MRAPHREPAVGVRSSKEAARLDGYGSHSPVPDRQLHHDRRIVERLGRSFTKRTLRSDVGRALEQPHAEVIGCLHRVEHARKRFRLDDRELRGILGSGSVLGHRHRHCLAEEADPVPGQGGASHHRRHPGRCGEGGEIGEIGRSEGADRSR